MITLTEEQAQQIELDIIEAQQYFGTYKIGEKALYTIRTSRARSQEQAEQEPDYFGKPIKAHPFVDSEDEQ